MFDRASRYANVPTATYTLTGVDGKAREVRYVRRRTIPPADTMTPVAQHVVTDGDRLDNITAQYLVDASQFWRVCDANTAMDPDELTEAAGRVLVIALPQT